MILLKIIYGIIFIILGYLLIKYRKFVKSWTGNFAWAERYLGSGGTYIVIIALGFFFIILGISYPFGGLEFIFNTK